MYKINTELYHNQESELNELKRITEIINNFEKKIDTLKKLNQLNDRKQEMYHYVLEKALYEVGDLSIKKFNVRDDIEKTYKKYYPNKPAFAKKLYLEHYADLHKPYDNLKNKIWKLIFKLSNENNSDEKKMQTSSITKTR